MTKDDIRDLAILVTEHLLDYAPDLLSDRVSEVWADSGDIEYTQETFDLQDSIEDALLSSSAIVAQIIKQ
jgi:hypothetical protein